MEDIDKTLELISIDVIERILSNDNTFSDFINNIGDFKDIDKDEYVAALNNYMSYAVKNSNGLSKSVFDRMNYINSLYQVNWSYNFEDYLSKTGKMVQLSTVEDILKNDNILNKFLDFDNNRDYFKENLIYYLSSINEYMTYFKDTMSMGIPLDVMERYKTIMKQYSLEYKKSQKLDGYDVKSRVDQSIIDKVIGNKYNDVSAMSTFDKFAMCRDIYIELCSLCNYDLGFAILKKDDNEAQYLDNVYKNDISNVTVNNSSVVCKSFSEIYAALLNKVGINAKVSGDYHKYVLFDCDGTLMKADGTNIFFNSSANFRLNDLAAVKMGLSTAGFICLEKEKDISKQVQMADLKNNFAKTTLDIKFRSEVDRYKNLSNFRVPIEIMSIEDKLKLLSDMCMINESDLDSLALSQYFSIIIDKVFNVEEKQMIDNKFMGIVGINNNFKAGVLLSINYNGVYKFYTFFKDGLSEIDRDMVRSLIESGTMRLMSSSVINGLYDKEVSNGIAM